jgi:FtsZ-binding cell division protein ZapB
MDSTVLLDLERKIGEAINTIVDLRKEKEILKKENLSLNKQLDGLKKEIEEFKKKLRKNASIVADSALSSAAPDIRKRLRKLAGKLAALEDSWN